MFKKIRRKINRLLPEYLIDKQAQNKVEKLFSPDDQPIVLVYQMGKVGSTSIYGALQKTEVGHRLAHVHVISDNIYETIQMHRDYGVKPLPSHLFVGRELNRKLKSGVTRNFKIITMVRDPIATFVSGVFQNPSFFDLDDHEKMTENSVVEKLQELINSKDSYHWILSWFDEEIKTVFGLDVYTIDFDKNVGWGLHESESLGLLLVQTEKIDSLPAETLESFIDSKVDMIAKHNVRKKVSKNASYSQVLSQLSVSQEVLDFVYDSKIARSFYSDNDIEKFRHKWQ